MSTLPSDDELCALERKASRYTRALVREVQRLRGYIEETSGLTVARALHESAESGGELAAQWADEGGVLRQAVALSADATVLWRRWFADGARWSSWHCGLTIAMLEAPAQLIPLDVPSRREARLSGR